MAAAAAAAARVAADRVCSRTKPEIYETASGKLIVEDEFLNFLVIKMRTLSQDEIVLLASNNFSSEWIEESKRLLFEICPKTTQRNVSHKGPQKDINNIKACLKVLNECGENIPRFVSHYLDDLPPITFGSIDVSALLGRMEQLNTEVSSMKRALETQANVCGDLQALTVDVTRRVTALEKPRGPSGSDHITGAAQEGEMQHTNFAVSEMTLNTVVMPGTPPQIQPQSPKWTDIVKEGRKLKSVPDNVVARPKTRINDYSKRVRKPMGIVGTGTASNIRVIKTKLVSVFATRFSPDLDADTLRNYLSEKLDRSVVCRKIESAQNRFSSFHVTAECNETAEMYDPQLWPAGTYVRRYYEARRPSGTLGSGGGGAGGSTGLQRSDNAAAGSHGSRSLGHTSLNDDSQ